MKYGTALKRLAASALFPAAFVAVGSAQAAIINTWHFEELTAFSDNYTPQASLALPAGVQADTANAEFNAVDPGVNHWNRLRWGRTAEGLNPDCDPTSDYDANCQSALFVDPGKFEGDFNLGDIAQVARVVHRNWTILDFETGALRTAELLTRLVLTPVPSDGSEQVETATFKIRFKETLNNDPVNCPVPGTSPLCSDIFVLETTEDLVFSFIQDNVKYTVNTLIDGLVELSDTQCTAAGQASGCFGVITVERQENPVDVYIQMTAEPISEPAILGLMGLTLAGIGFLGRRKNAA